MSRLWRLADALAEQIFASAREATPERSALRVRLAAIRPVDVQSIAAALGVQVFHGAAVKQEGLLCPSLDGWAVLVPGDEDDPRARFSVAHELIHLALREPAIGGEAAQRAVSAPHGFRSVERLCDCAGAALLLPQPLMNQLRMHAREQQLDGQLGRCVLVARQAHVSLSAAFIRLRGLERWQSMLVQWTRGRRGWRVQTEVGLDEALWAQAVFDDRMIGTLQALSATAGMSTQRRQLPMTLDGEESHVIAEVVVGNATITAVIEEPRPVLFQPTARDQRAA